MRGHIVSLILAYFLCTVSLLAQEFDLIPYRNKNKWGYCTKDKVMKISCKYEEANIFNDGAAAVKKNGKYGYIKKDSSLLTSFIYDEAYGFSAGYAMVRISSKWYRIDKLGNQFTEMELGRCGGGRILPYFGMQIKKNGKYGFQFEDTNKRIIPIIYEELKENYNNKYYVKLHDKWGMIDDQNRVIVPFQYDAILINPFENYDLVRVEKNGVVGYIDNNSGKLIIPIKYQEANAFQGYLARVKYNNHYGYINRKGLEYFKD